MKTERLGTNLARTVLGASYNDEHYYTMQNRADGLVIQEYEKGTNRLVDTITLQDTFSEDKVVKTYQTIEPVDDKNAWNVAGAIILSVCVIGVIGILIFLLGGS